MSPSTDRLEVLDPSPIGYDELPMAGDEDLERQLDARYGGGLHTYRFRRVRIPVSFLKEHLLELEEIALEDDGRRRRAIAEGYRDAFLSSADPDPIVIAMEEKWMVLDGFHRAAGARAAGRTHLDAFELLPD